MSRNPHGLILLGIVGVIPVLLCLIGVGVLLYMASEESSATAAQLLQRQHAAAQLKEKNDALRRSIAELEKQLQEVDRRLAEAKKSQHLQSLIAQLQQEKQRLQQELAEWRKKWETIQNDLAQKTQDLQLLQQQVQEAQGKLAFLLQKIQEMQPGPGVSQDPGPTIAQLEAMKRQTEEQLQTENQIYSQKLAERNRLAQEVKSPNPSVIKIQEVRGAQEWQLPPNPLYVECQDQEIVLQPENRRLPAKPDSSQQEEFLRTVRERKYVLFLIRPNGFQTFRDYRKLLQHEANRIDYGYEPIRQDARILYPERN